MNTNNVSEIYSLTREYNNMSTLNFQEVQK